MRRRATAGTRPQPGGYVSMFQDSDPAPGHRRVLAQPRRRQCALMRSAARQPRSGRADPQRSSAARRIRHLPPPSRWPPSPCSDSDLARAGTSALRSRIRRSPACSGSAAGNECWARWRKHPLVYPLVSAESHRRLRLLRMGYVRCTNVFDSC